MADTKDVGPAQLATLTEVAQGRTSLYLAYKLTLGTSTAEETAEAVRRLRSDPVDFHRQASGGGAAGGGGLTPATGATAGIPGAWTPAGATPPATLVDLMNGVPNVVVASPTSAWTTGQHVQTATVGAAGRATWTGSAWVGGVAP